MTRARFVAPLAGLALFAVGCGNQTPGVTTDPADDLRGRTFLSVQASGKDVPPGLRDSHEIRLSFHEDGRLSAKAGCNTTQGKVGLDDKKVALSDTSSTAMSCPDALHQRDAWLSDLLSDNPKWSMADKRLTMTAGSTKLVFADERDAVPNRPLTQTRWAVESVRNENSVSAPRNADRAYLTVKKNGEFAGSTGCNGMGGEVSVGKDTLKFSGPIMTRMACHDGPGLESDIATVLDGKVDYTIHGDRLLLSHPSGTALELRAVPKDEQSASPSPAKDR